MLASRHFLEAKVWNNKNSGLLSGLLKPLDFRVSLRDRHLGVFQMKYSKLKYFHLKAEDDIIVRWRQGRVWWFTRWKHVVHPWSRCEPRSSQPGDQLKGWDADTDSHSIIVLVSYHSQCCQQITRKQIDTRNK